MVLFGNNGILLPMKAIFIHLHCECAAPPVICILYVVEGLPCIVAHMARYVLVVAVRVSLSNMPGCNELKVPVLPNSEHSFTTEARLPKAQFEIQTKSPESTIDKLSRVGIIHFRLYPF